jgi:sortase A
MGKTRQKKQRKQKKRNVLLTIIIVAIFLVGFGLLMYPTFSNLWNEYRNSRLITKYSETVESMSDEDIENEWNEAAAYNEQHRSNTIVDAFSEENDDTELTSPYKDLLNLSGDGVMGSIEIPKIDVNLAIYHGTGSDVLERGVGHVEGTSLPVGGSGTHCVLAGHRGLPSAKLFTDLDELEVGDIFYIHVLDRTLAYQVDQIKTVLPEDTEDIAIEEGKDYVTLLTCTPYGVNTHRLLVRGVRIPYEEAEEQEPSSQTEGSGTGLSIFTLVVPILVGILVCVIIVAVVVRRRKNRNKSSE